MLYNKQHSKKKKTCIIMDCVTLKRYSKLVRLLTSYIDSLKRMSGIIALMCYYIINSHIAVCQPSFVLGLCFVMFQSYINI